LPSRASPPTCAAATGALRINQEQVRLSWPNYTIPTRQDHPFPHSKIDEPIAACNEQLIPCLDTR
jgi:hypothetical protein